MELTMKIFTFSKKFNSTKQPTGGGKTVMVVWDSPYSTDEPDIECRAEEISATANYAYIPQFNRYYWIDKNRKFRDNGHATIHLICDVLATYKPYIMQQTFFVDKNEKTYNSLYADSRLVCYNRMDYGGAVYTIPMLSASAFSMYYAEIVGKESSGTFTNCYILSPGELGTIAKILLDDTDFQEAYVQGVADSFTQGDNPSILAKAMAVSVSAAENGPYHSIDMDNVGNKARLYDGLFSGASSVMDAIGSSIREQILKPSEAIVRIVALACKIPTIFETQNTKVYLGQFDSGITARQIFNPWSKIQEAYFTIPWRYIDSQGGVMDFRNRAEYTKIDLVLPTGNTIELPTNRLYGHTTVYLKYRLNAATGDIIGVLYLPLTGTEIGDVLASFSFNIGTDIAISSKSELFGNVAVSMATGLPKMLAGMGNPIMAAYSIANYGTNSIINPMLESAVASSSGATSGATLLTDQIQIVVSSTGTQSPSELNPLGRLLRKPMQLSSLSGFTVCTEAHADVPATYQEQQRLDNFLNSGFYIE